MHAALTEPATSLQEPVRILSDLHFGHPASTLESAEQLAPLFEGVKTVVFNGDSVELRYLRGRRVGMRNARLLREACAVAGVQPVFINGNHDPILSHVSHLDLADGAVLVTHGDLLFHDISPWSSEAPIMGAAHTRELAGLEADALLDFESRLKASKRAALAIELHRPRLRRDRLSYLRTLARECWPPWRPFQVFHSWWVTPRMAEALARTFRPQASFILIGHTHFAGTWRRGPRTIINTGSFLPMSGMKAIDLCGHELTVRKIILEKGLFKPGPRLVKYTATKLPQERDG